MNLFATDHMDCLRHVSRVGLAKSRRHSFIIGGGNLTENGGAAFSERAEKKQTSLERRDWKGEREDNGMGAMYEGFRSGWELSDRGNKCV